MGLAIGYVLSNGAEKQKWLLQHQPNVLPVVCYGVGANVDPIDQNCPLRYVVKAANQVHQRALARAAVAHQTDHLTGGNFQANGTVHFAIAIPKARLAHLYVPLDFSHGHGLEWLRHAGDVVQNVKDTFGCGRRFLGVRDNTAHGI